MANVRGLLRHSLLRFRRARALTAVIVLILAVGIGVSTAVFGVVRRVLVRPLPVAELDRLVVAWEIDPAREGSLIEVSYPYFRDWRAQNRSLEDLAAYGCVNWRFEFKRPLPREALAPAWVASELPIAPTLRSGGAGGGLDRRGFELTRLLVTFEIALSVVLLVGSGSVESRSPAWSPRQRRSSPCVEPLASTRPSPYGASEGSNRHTTSSPA